MNAHASYAAATQTLLSLAAVSPNEQLFDLWRGSHAEVSDHIDMVQQHLRTIARGTDRLAYLDHCRACLVVRIPRYLAAVRRVTEAEIEMAQRGVRFPKSSDAWSA